MVDVERFRAELARRRAELEQALTTSGRFSKPVELDQASVGRLSRMDAIQQQEMALAAQRRHGHELARIDAALKRIEAGDYGWCVQCDAEIPERRLALDPAAPLCVQCAGKGT